ncbi:MULTISPECIES: uracil-DNA glycosylase [unclassified Herbaspirillum]|uniref:uracil-DNA glycosylase n=1 Tax=unclassified Herbaspirillum TaxID=2624150 RepID=UPI000C0A5536|nr:MULTISPECIES: uracil-DNA glycosylase [unclassified Herbaspirillum]MAF05593.1 uracil-DNA glycosylase [Herbaspirillum sp.]MBO17785.1 uracil-DNA glycosylase [Herbaspirillum sp.]|tara:strand:+ start:2023 stop:2820 length:798 start_codon:yes stop_codon:yes gene_type:complete
MSSVSTLPAPLSDLIQTAHPSWHAALRAGLEAIQQADPAYLSILAQDDYLPTEGRLFAAFTQPMDQVRYVLVGEGPYPRAASATGVCFMDGAVGSLWSEKGLSKQVNRATSLRNFMKMLLVAEGALQAGQTSGDALAGIAAQAQADVEGSIQTLADLQDNLTAQGFLLLNASLVFRSHVAPIKDAKGWKPFFETVLRALAEHGQAQGKSLPTLVLWGKIAEQLSGLPLVAQFPRAVAEHPYNLSFIEHSGMQQLFAPMQLLKKRA